MMPTKTIISIMSLTLTSMIFASPAIAEYSPWMKISKTKPYGKSLARKKLIPVKIECKRGAGRVYWRNTLFRVKLVPESKIRITGWKIEISQTYEGGRGMSRQAKAYYNSRVVVPPRSSGISAHCGIIHYTKNKIRFRQRRKLF